MSSMDYIRRVEEYKHKRPDFEQVVNRPDIIISADVHYLIASMENGPAVAYYLGLNPDFARNLCRLAPINAGYELGLLSAKLEGE